MGRTVYWMNVSLDLRIAREVDDAGSGSWLSIDEELHRDFNRRAATMTTAVEGRVIYEIMEPFWPAAIDDETLPDFLREYGRIWTDMPKVMLSNTRTEAKHNTRIIGGPDAIEQIAELRRTTDGEIGVGGATVATQLLEHGLLDELLLYTHPVLLGAGRPLFDRMPTDLELDLLEAQTFTNGVVLRRYDVVRPG